MSDKFKSLLQQYITISEEEAGYAIDNFPIYNYQTNEVFFREGSFAKAVFFVLEGCVRLFYNVEGNERTASFFTEGKFFCANESLLKKIPARENFQALENTTVLSLIHI